MLMFCGSKMANGIPEWLTLELILGVYASIISSLTFILYFIKLRRERPNLKVDVLNCKHSVSINGNSTYLHIKYTLRNTGDRETQLNKIEAFATDFNGEKHYASETVKATRNLLGAHRILTLFHYFCFTPHFQYREKMECNFKLHHTHEVFEFQCESEESESPIS